MRNIRPTPFDTKTLKAAIRRVELITLKRDRQGMHGMTRITTEGSALALHSWTRCAHASTTITHCLGAEFDVLVSTAALAAIGRRLDPNKPTTCKTRIGHAEITNGANVYALETLAVPSNWPTIVGKPKHIMTINVDSAREAFNATRLAASDEYDMPVLQQTHLVATKAKGARAEATDRYTAVIVNLYNYTLDRPCDLLVNAEDLAHVVNRSDSRHIGISATDADMFIDDGQTTYVLPLFKADYPNLPKVMAPYKEAATAGLPPGALAAALRQLDAATPTNYAPNGRRSKPEQEIITLSYGYRKLTVTRPDTGTYTKPPTVTTEAANKGTGQWNIQRRFLENALTLHQHADTITITGQAPDKPIHITSPEGSTVIMPVRQTDYYDY